MFRFGDPGGRVYGSAGTIQNYWGSGSGIANFSLQSGQGRNGGSCIRSLAAANNYVLRAFDNQQTWGVAFAFRVSGVTTSNPIISFFDGTSTQCDLRINTSLQLYVTRNNTTLGIAASALSANTWNHIEVKCKIDNSTGTLEVRVNEVAVIGPLTGQDTQNTSNAYANVIILGYFGGVGGLGNLDWDDIIIWDGQATDSSGNPDINDFIGDCALNWSIPNGAGTSTQFTPDSGSNYSRVADATVDDDTSYVESSTLNNIDSYAIANLPTTVQSVKSLATIHYCRKTDAGGKQMGSVIRTGATNYLHPNNIYLGDSYQYQFRNWGTNPNTLAAWTVSDVNGIESGQKVLS